MTERYDSSALARSAALHGLLVFLLQHGDLGLHGCIGQHATKLLECWLGARLLLDTTHATDTNGAHTKQHVARMDAIQSINRKKGTTTAA